MSGLRTVYFVLGWVMLALGAAGVVLPLLPTTPFVLASAWFFTRSSPRATAWLLLHPVLGPPLQRWQRDRSISTRTKLVAICSIGLSYAIAYGFGRFSPMILIMLATILLTVATFILTRPTPSGVDPMEGP